MASARIEPMLRRVRLYGELVMFSHTLFSLPFALIAMFLAAGGLPSAKVIFWILLALFAGRNGANALNRWVDAEYDALNPRTAHRHIPQGTLKKKDALVLSVLCGVVFVLSAAMLNPLCLALSPVALALFALYSYTKRFTWFCHLILGITCAGAPVGAWIAVTGRLDWIPLVLAAAVTLWISGFDILYGTQDIAFDREHDLHSIPARFGLQRSLTIAKFLHGVMWLLLVIMAWLTALSIPYLIGVGISGILLILEHRMVNPAHPKAMNVASYHLNQIISTILLISASLDIFVL